MTAFSTMPIHNFVDNIVNSATLFVNSAAPSSSKVYLSSFSFLLFEKETLHTSLVSNSFISYNTAKNSLLVNFASNIKRAVSRREMLQDTEFNLFCWAIQSWQVCYNKKQYLTNKLAKWFGNSTLSITKVLTNTSVWRIGTGRHWVKSTSDVGNPCSTAT